MEEDINLFEDEPNMGVANALRDSFFDINSNYAGRVGVYCFASKMSCSTEELNSYISSLSQGSEPELEM